MRPASALAALALCALAGGCGGASSRPLSKEDYVAKIRALESSDTVLEATNAYTDMAGGKQLTQSECADDARMLHSDLQTIVDEVDALRAPSDVQALQDRFVAAGQETVDTVGGLADEIGKGDLVCGEPFNRRAYGLPSTTRAEAVIEELGRRGYIFGLNSED